MVDRNGLAWLGTAGERSLSRFCLACLCCGLERQHPHQCLVSTNGTHQSIFSTFQSPYVCAPPTHKVINTTTAVPMLPCPYPVLPIRWSLLSWVVFCFDINTASFARRAGGGGSGGGAAGARRRRAGWRGSRCTGCVAANVGGKV